MYSIINKRVSEIIETIGKIERTYYNKCIDNNLIKHLKKQLINFNDTINNEYIKTDIDMLIKYHLYSNISLLDIIYISQFFYGLRAGYKVYYLGGV